MQLAARRLKRRVRHGLRAAVLVDVPCPSGLATVDTRLPGRTMPAALELDRCSHWRKYAIQRKATGLLFGCGATVGGRGLSDPALESEAGSTRCWPIAIVHPHARFCRFDGLASKVSLRGAQASERLARESEGPQSLDHHLVGLLANDGTRGVLGSQTDRRIQEGVIGSIANKDEAQHSKSAGALTLALLLEVESRDFASRHH